MNECQQYGHDWEVLDLQPFPVVRCRACNTEYRPYDMDFSEGVALVGGSHYDAVRAVQQERVG
jgi:hypothetical protein